MRTFDQTKDPLQEMREYASTLNDGILKYSLEYSIYALEDIIKKPLWEEEIINKLEGVKGIYFMAFANKGDIELDLAYKNIKNIIDQAIMFIEKDKTRINWNE